MAVELRDILEVRRGKVVPAVAALIIAAFAWFGAQSMLSWFTSESVSTPAAEAKGAEAAQTQAAETAAPQPAKKPPPIYPNVLVATHGLQSGVMLTAELVDWQEWTEPIDINMVVLQDAVPLATVLGSVTRQAYAPGTPIGWGGIISPGSPGFISAVLAPGMRAVTVEVDRATTSANIIHPGDRVDVIMVSAQQSAEALAQAIVHNVRVLAVGSTILSIGRYGKSTLAPGGGVEPVQQPAGENYTLELLPVDAERISLAANAGRLTLAMRSVNAQQEYDWAPPRPVSLSEVLVKPAPPPANPPVRIIRGSAARAAVAVDS